MKQLTEFKDEIHKCSKCGLCQSVCPVYEQTGNDCSVSRGKFIMLNGVVKGDLKLNKNINKYLDMCLKCNACKNFCPSDIDARKIFLAAKSEYFKTCPSSKIIKAFHSKLIFNFVLKLTRIATNTYRLFKMDKLVKTFYPLLNRFELGKKSILANEFVAKSNVKSIKTKALTNETKIVYFKGCVNEYINPRTKNAGEYITGQIGVEVLTPYLPLDCCGIPFLSSGNAEQFKKQAEFNISQIPDDFDYFITDCASCQSAFREYENYIDDEKLLKKIKKINKKSINIVDFTLNNIESIEFNEKITFTFHKPCHLEDLSFLKEFLSKSKNVEYIEMDEYDKCCGFSGEFAVKNPKISKKISAKKAQNAIKTNADYIITSCPACILGLTQGTIEFQKAGHKTIQTSKPLNFIEFIALADKILPKKQ